jgi:hypothetical protein
LSRWDLETYLWLKTKGLEETIRFCNKDFYSWLNDKVSKEYLQEFENIANNIFGLK